MKRDQRIRARLARHAELMAHWEAEGWSRDTASAKAYEDLLREADADQPKSTTTKLTVRQ